MALKTSLPVLPCDINRPNYKHSSVTVSRQTLWRQS